MFLLGAVCFVLLSLRLDAAADYEQDLVRTGAQTARVITQSGGRRKRERFDVSYAANGGPRRAHFYSTDRNRWHVGDTVVVFYDRDGVDCVVGRNRRTALVEEAARGLAGRATGLDQDEFARLLGMLDRRTTGASVTWRCCTCSARPAWRRAEADLLVSDVDERRRSSVPRLRAAMARSTSWWVALRCRRRGRTARCGCLSPGYVVTRRRPDLTVERGWSGSGRGNDWGAGRGCGGAESQGQLL